MKPTNASDALPTVPTAAGLSQDPVDDHLAAEMRRRHIPGLALSVVRHGEVVKLKGYGQANSEWATATTAETVFQIQSITKTFTALAVLLLVEEGRLAVDDWVCAHFANAPASWEKITLRHLFSHTSGIPDYINEPTQSLRLDVTDAEVFDATAARPLHFTPGEKYSYTNTGYHLLAMIIRKLTGMGFGDFLRQRFFEPVGMSATRIVSWTALIPRCASGHAWRHGALQHGEYIAESVLGYGGGGIVSTANDMAKWAIALDAGKVLPRPVLEAAWAGTTLNDGSTAAYGLGWRIATVNGRRTVGHGGAHSTGFTSHFLHFPDDGLTVTVLTNAVHAQPLRIAQEIAGMFDPAVVPPEIMPIEDKEPHVTELVRAVLQGVGRGDVDAARFPAQVWATLGPWVARLRSEGHLKGEPGILDLMSRAEVGAERNYRYRAAIGGRAYLVTLTMLGGAIIEFDIDPW